MIINVKVSGKLFEYNTITERIRKKKQDNLLESDAGWMNPQTVDYVQAVKPKHIRLGLNKQMYDMPEKYFGTGVAGTGKRWIINQHNRILPDPDGIFHEAIKIARKKNEHLNSVTKAN